MLKQEVPVDSDNFHIVHEDIKDIHTQLADQGIKVEEKATYPKPTQEDFARIYALVMNGAERKHVLRAIGDIEEKLFG